MEAGKTFQDSKFNISNSNYAICYIHKVQRDLDLWHCEIMSKISGRLLLQFLIGSKKVLYPQNSILLALEAHTIIR